MKISSSELWLCVQSSISWINRKYLGSLSTDTTSQLDILGHDSNTLGVDGTQVGILKESNKVGLGGFLKGQDGRSLESKIGLEILGNLTNKTLERQLANEKVGGLLVTTNLTKSDSTWAISVGLLDTSSGGGTLTSSLGGKLLTGSLSSGGLAGGLLGSGHFLDFFNRVLEFCERSSVRDERDFKKPTNMY